MSTTVAPALEELGKVGTLLTSDEDLREFRDPFAFASWDDYTASAVVMPETVEQIQEIVRIANRHGVPLWTHGAGRNNGKVTRKKILRRETPQVRAISSNEALKFSKAARVKR